MKEGKKDSGGWVRDGFRSFRKVGTGFEITRDVNDHGKKIWICRLNGRAFDAADSVAAAKMFCK